ncbi:MAG: hypothetical protein AAB497_02790 [Patescibacteria group bacterium]
MYELFYVVAVLTGAIFWMKFVEWVGWGLTPILLFTEEKLQKLEKMFSPPADPKKEDRLQQAGDLCPKCEKGSLRMEYRPFHPLMSADAYAPLEPWPFDFVCSFCGESIPGKY